MAESKNVLPVEVIANKIYLIRGQKVMFDFDLSELYGVETKYLIRAVKRNPERFPPDFMFQLNKEEFKNLRFQFGTSKWGGRRYLPYAFTEYGAVMLASVLNSSRAVKMSIYVVRAFVKLRQIFSSYEKLDKRLVYIERKVLENRNEIINLWRVIKELLSPPPEEPKRRIGFCV